jgi:plasmid stabilization system protein ParE
VTRPVLFRPEAAAEALETRGWYAAREAKLGQRFSDDLAATVLRVVARPAMFPRVRGEIRRAVLRRFPYAVYFREDPDTIVVLAVHGRQDPKRWQSRS